MSQSAGVVGQRRAARPGTAPQRWRPAVRTKSSRAGSPPGCRRQMGKYSQSNQPMSVTTPLGADALLLEGFSGNESISGLFRFELELLAESATTVGFDQVLG